MYLSRLQIFGFKSFLHKITFKFDGQICALVGPNGCGKTNIVDAIRWVLGEQRPTLLRGERMEEVIFHGTKSRKPLGMAEVAITIDNSAHLLPIEFTEVTITRRLFRSGESEYLLNRVPCRLKDIHHLLCDTGMGVGTYSILSQELIDTLLSSKEEERRLLLEEAAGITKYKSQRKETLGKLELTKRDLVRIGDLISEVEKRVATLGRQARSARLYQERMEEINRLSLLLAKEEYGKLQGRLDELRDGIKSLRDEVSQEEAKVRGCSMDFEGIARRLKKTRSELSSQKERMNSVSRKLNSLRGEISLKKERIRNLDELLRREGREEEKLRNRLAETKAEEGEIAKELADLSPQILMVEKQWKDLEGKLVRLEDEYLTIQREVEKLRGELSQLRDRYQEQRAKKERLSVELEGLRDQERLLKGEKIRISEKLKGAEEEKSQSISTQKSLIDKLEKVERELARRRKGQQAAEEKLNKLAARREGLKGLLSSLESQIALLRQLINQREGLPSGAKSLLRKRFPKIKGALADLIEAKEGYEDAIEGALGQAIQYLIVEDLQSAQECLLWLKSQKAGKAALIPLDGVSDPDSSPPLPPKSIGWAKDLVRCDPQYKPILDFLLHRFVVVKEIPPHPQKDFHWVSLDGETHLAWGLVSGGGSAQVVPLIGRERRLAQLCAARQGYLQEEKRLLDQKRVLQGKIGREGERIRSLDREREEMRKDLHQVEGQIERVNFLLEEYSQRGKEIASRLKETLKRKKALERSLAPVLDELRGVEEKIGKVEGELQEKNNLWRRREAERNRFTRKMNEGRMKLISLEGRREELQGRLGRLAEIQETLEENIRERGGEKRRIHGERKKIAEEVHQIEEQLARLVSQEEELSARMREVVEEERRLSQRGEKRGNQLKVHRERAAELASQLHSLEVEYAQVEAQAGALRQKVEGDFGIGMDEIQGPSKEEEVTAERIEFLKERLRRQGPVNLLALEEYQKEKERLDFLRSQKEDLEGAEASLERAIAKIDYTAREKFLQTIERIDINFQEVFRELFSGGEAHLRLKPGVDPLEAGVEISVSPEGKRLFNLGQLSGGEKTLTAIAFLFSLYLIKPSPFCILDEVDAPLDDENVERFLRLVKKFSQNSQFIIITHNKRTMAEADILYGITMEEPGVSKLVSVKVKGD